MSAGVETEQVPFIQQAIESGRITVLQILVFSIALLLNMLDGFDVTAMSFTVHSIGENLNIPVDRLGLVFSAALAGMMLGALFIAPMSDVVGRRKMILACVLTIGVSMVATAFSTKLWHLLSLRSVTGLGVGGMLASLAAISAEFTPKKYRSLAVVGITVGYPFGAMVGGYIAAFLMKDFGWQSVFFFGGFATLMMGVVACIWLPESMQFLLTQKNRNVIPELNAVLTRLGQPSINALPEIKSTERDKANVFSLLTEERRTKTLVLWACFLFCFVSLYFMLSWIPKLVVIAGLSETTGVYASVAFNGGAIFGAILLGWIASRVGLTNIISFFLISAAILMFIYSAFSGINHLFLYLCGIGFLLQGGFTGLYAVAAKMYPAQIRVTGVGWAIGLGRFGAVVGPYIGGLLIAGGVGMEMNFVIFAVPLLISGLIAYYLAVR